MFANGILKPVRTLIAESDEIVLVGLKHTLRQMPEVLLVADVRNSKAAVEMATAMAVDLVIMGSDSPELDSLKATKLIKESLPAKVIMFTSNQQEQNLVSALIAGADAFCVKGISSSQFVKVIRSVLIGGSWIDPSVAGMLRVTSSTVERTASPAMPTHIRNTLSRREKEVLQLLSLGLTNQEIAEKLSVGPETVKTHIRHLMDKLGVTHRTQAAVKAVQAGWLETDSTL